MGNASAPAGAPARRNRSSVRLLCRTPTWRSWVRQTALTLLRMQQENGRKRSGRVICFTQMVSEEKVLPHKHDPTSQWVVPFRKARYCQSLFFVSDKAYLFTCFHKLCEDTTEQNNAADLSSWFTCFNMMMMFSITDSSVRDKVP